MQLKCFILLVAFLFCQGAYAGNILTGHYQLLVVTSDSWQDKQGHLQRFEKRHDHEEWIPIGESIPVVLGKAGMAWGIGLHPSIDKSDTFKIEGDLKAPAGIFSLGYAFGFPSSSEMAHLKIDYLPLNEFIEAVDDPSSRYYNCIVDSREKICDWNSTEKMGSVPLYEIGLVVNHNWPNSQPGKGSAIFLHLWRNENSGTAGCTAMGRDNLEKVLCWLDRSKNPLLVQLPYPIYCDLQEEWELPEKKLIK